MLVYMAHQTDSAPSLLARFITERLATLSMSRREFVRRTDLSRQTLHNIEREGLTSLWPTTFAALDRGLEWPKGTAEGLAKGDPSAIERVQSIERLAAIRNQVMHRVETMNLSELENLAHVMETMAFGTHAASTEDHVAKVESRLADLERRLGGPREQGIRGIG